MGERRFGPVFASADVPTHITCLAQGTSLEDGNAQAPAMLVRPGMTCKKAGVMIPIILVVENTASHPRFPEKAHALPPT